MIHQLCKEIETAIGKQPKTPKDFDQLREMIYGRLHSYVGRTTLMRIWGYVDEAVEPRQSTLDILSQYLGYHSWEDYQQNVSLQQERQSSPVLSRHLNVPETLKHGDRLRLTWQPQRVCDVEYLGDLTFRVIASEKTRLQAGDTFQCSLIIEREPLYLDNLRQGTCPPIAYVCGKKSGVCFEFIPSATQT